MSDASDVGKRDEPRPVPLLPTLDPTGVPQLDTLLGGGLPRGALTFVVGPPGSGKTTLAAQLAIAAAVAGRKALILTAFSEPVTKLITHLRTMNFFDENLLGESLQVLSLAQFLPQGLDATADEIRTLVRRSRYTIVVLDGFRGVRSPSDDEQAARRFLYHTGSALSLLDATTVITSEAEPRDASLYPEATTADVLLGMHYRLVGLRESRNLEVIKVRGLAKMSGLHVLALSASGVTLYPRLESLVGGQSHPSMLDRENAEDAPSAPGRRQKRRLGFGLPELDALLGGGLTPATSTILLGSPGAGKTLLALQWLIAGLETGERALFLGFRENLRQIQFAADAFTFGPTLRAAVQPGGPIKFVRLAPVELDPDVMAHTALQALDQVGARRVVIDGIGELERAVAEVSGTARTPGFLAALMESLHERQVTTLALRESTSLVASGLSVATDTLSALADNVILAQQLALGGSLRRVISVPKMRFSAHDSQLHEFTIDAPEGIRVLRPIDTDSAALIGKAGVDERHGLAPAPWLMSPRADGGSQ